MVVVALLLKHRNENKKYEEWWMFAPVMMSVKDCDTGGAEKMHITAAALEGDGTGGITGWVCDASSEVDKEEIDLLLQCFRCMPRILQERCIMMV